MKMSKSAKLSVFTTLVCLVLCGSMLLGNTYAWFSDEVKNESNVIKTGTLKVKMYYHDQNESIWTDAAEGAIFDYKLWEPGYTDVKYIKIDNAGDLAFNFSLKLIADEEATNGVKLSEVIDVYMDTAVSNRGDITNMKYVGTLADLMADADGAAYGIMYAGDTMEYCIALKMQESAGNEYQNLSIGEGIKVQLYAEQRTHEEDSFGPDYDANSGLPVAAVYRAAEFIDTELTWDGYSPISGKTLDTAYVFKTTESEEETQASAYANWNADFEVSFSREVTAADKVGLAGQYGTFDWIGMEADENALNALGGSISEGTTLRLLKDVMGGFYMQYGELYTWGANEFYCGAWGDPATPLTMTVKLRLYETVDNVETGKSVTIGSYSYTFGEEFDDTSSDLPEATVKYLDVPAQDMTISTDLTDNNFTDDLETVTIKPDAAFTFVAQDDAESVASNPYKDWLVDYYVSVNESIEDGVVLVGAYGNWENGAWFGFNAPAGDYITAVPLLGTMTGGTSNWTYEDIVTGVEEFNCGVYNGNDKNNGKVMTVELRIINPENPSESYVIESIEHTFQ